MWTVNFPRFRAKCCCDIRFYEEVIEADLENLTSVQISLANINGLRLSLNVCCEADLSIFLNKGNVLYEMDDDAGYQHLVFIIEGGAAV